MRGTLGPEAIAVFLQHLRQQEPVGGCGCRENRRSALSYHLANLEAEIGAPLFTRKSRGLEATAAGERLYFHARSILKTVEVAKRDLSTFRDNVSGEVSLAMAYSAIQAIGVQLAKVVVEDYPDLQLNMIESLSSTTLLHLSSADAIWGWPTTRR